MQLLEVFKDFEVIVKGRLGSPQYKGDFLLVRKNNSEFPTLQDLENYVARLQRKFPNRRFQVKVRKYKGKVYYIVDQDIWVRQRGRRKQRKKDRVPIFFDFEEQKVFIPKSFWERNKRLVGYILMRTLGSLGISTVKYIGRGG